MLPGFPLGIISSSLPVVKVSDSIPSVSGGTAGSVVGAGPPACLSSGGLPFDSAGDFLSSFASLVLARSDVCFQIPLLVSGEDQK